MIQDTSRHPTTGSFTRLTRTPGVVALALLLGALGLFVAQAQAQISQPTGLTVTSKHKSLVLSWNTVSGADYYEVHFTSASEGTVRDDVDGDPDSTDGAAGWAIYDFPVDPSLTITGLTNGTRYRVRVQAVMGVETSSWEIGMGTPGSHPHGLALCVPEHGAGGIERNRDRDGCRERWLALLRFR